ARPRARGGREERLPRAAAPLDADLRLTLMAAPTTFSEVVEAEGHLIDSQILNVVFDTVVKHNASFDVLRFDIGRSNNEPSSIAMRISAASESELEDVLEELVALGCRLSDTQDALTRPAERDGCVADDF